jgi:hypothetical protein
MKIMKILFLGIVLVTLNIAYLAAANLPDTIYVRSAPVKPGDTLNLSVGANFHTDKPGGLIAVFQLDSILALGLDTTAGKWYSWTTSFGQVLVDNATQGLVTLDGRTLSVTIFGVNVAQLATFGLIPATRAGDLVNFKFYVKPTVAENDYPVTSPADGRVILPWPITNPLFADFPVVITPDIMVANIPTYDALQMGATAGAMIGSTFNLPVKVENQDAISSGSFTVDYPSSLLTFSTVSAGPRAGGMAFSSTISTVSASVKRAAVTFTGGTVAVGGLGTLCNLVFSVPATAPKTSGTATLAAVVLKDALGVALAAAIQPSSPTTTIGTFYGDSLIVNVSTGDFSVISVSDRKVNVPVRLKNSVPVSIIRFRVLVDPAKPAGILRLVDVKTTDRTAGASISFSDSTSQIIAMAPDLATPLAAGDGDVFTLVYDILAPLTPAQLPMDVSMSLRGVEIYDNTGAAVGVEQVNGVVSLDQRVPNSGEGVGPGSSLPKAFSLGQNHPNPFNPSTTINYQIPDGVNSGVSFNLSVFDIRGRMIKTLANGVKGPGYYSAYWDGTDYNGQQVGSGVYFYRFSSEKYNSTRKMIMLK